ncbi:MAG: hypothetical protein Q7S78_00120 [Candidatus Azambacteria bacterium]|nr:hypothetical protein [Candidatus Azambacteria bacterium]
MSESFEIIRARTKDDAAILIDRLMKSKHQEVILALPKNSILVTDLNSLKILKEEAESIGKTLSISTENDDIREFAQKIQLPVFDSAPPIEEKKIKRMFDIVRPPVQDLESEPEPKSELEPQIEPPVTIYEATSKTDLEKNLEEFYNNQPIEKLSPKKFFSFGRTIKVLMVIGILLLGAAMYLVLPKADIKLSLKEMPVSATISVAVSKSISMPDFANGIIPGQYFLLTKSGSKIIETSNETANLPSKYGGAIEIYNAYSAAAQKLVAQTRFETKDGKIFKIQNAVIVPGAKMSGSNLIPSSVKAEVISDTIGEEYKIEPSFFTIPGFEGTAKFAGFYAKSAETMIPVKNKLALADQNTEKVKKTLENALVTELKNEVLNTFKASDLRLIDGASTVKIDEFAVASNVATMKISWQAIFFKESDFKALVSYFVSAKYPDLKNFNFKDNITYPQATKSDFKKGEAFFTFNFDKSNAFSTDIAGLKKELTGLDETGMRNIISNKNFIQSATISLWPFWVRQAPGNPEKINIILDK